MTKPAKRVTVTGAAGQICYALLFRIANGDLLGKDQPVILHLLDLPQAQTALGGVVMELDDCAFPLLRDIVVTDDPKTAFRDTDYGLLVGARPRSKGMERRDLLSANAEIFKIQGAAINEAASRDVKILVVGNPANTNALIAQACAPDIDPGNFSAMLRLDHNRALTMLSKKAGCAVDEIEYMTVWGNHSPTMFPDYAHATVKGRKIADIINDENWYRETFVPAVAKRGTAVIEARGASSAASAANAAIDHMRDWALGSGGKWVSMGLRSDGSYGVPEGLFCGVPVVCSGGHYQRVKGLDLSPFAKERIDISIKELAEERDAVKALVG